jgi:hypothetical protein
MDSFNKKPLDLRDRRVLDIDATQVSKLTVLTDTPSTTQPTTKAASKNELVLERKKQSLALGPEMPLLPCRQPGPPLGRQQDRQRKPLRPNQRPSRRHTTRAAALKLDT